MPSRTHRLVEEMRALSENERADVLAQVLPSPSATDDEDDAAWELELQRRLQSVQDGTAQVRDFDASYSELVAKFRRE